MTRKILVFVAALLFSIVASAWALPDPVQVIRGSGINDKLDAPSGIAIDGKGNIYVLNVLTNRITIFRPDGSFMRTFEGEGDYKLSLPGDIAFSVDGQFVYISEFSQHRILKFDKNLKFIGSYGGFGSEAGQFVLPFALDVAPNGDLYVLDTGNNRVQVFDRDMKRKLGFGESGILAGQFEQPQDIAVGSDYLVVADTGNNRIQIFDHAGKFISKFGVAGSGNTDLISPRGVSVDSNDHIYVSDSGNNRVSVYSRQGELLLQIGNQGEQYADFNAPKKSTIGKNGRLYVVDTGNSRVLSYRPQFHVELQGRPCVKCHQEQVEQPSSMVLHDQSGDCVTCHKIDRIISLSGLRSKGRELCFDCHTQVTTGRYVHGPLAGGECTICHQPHGSPNKFMLKALNTDLCSLCHADVKAGMDRDKYAHSPAQKGECNFCHDPHKADNKNYLKTSVGKTCLSCHGKKRSMRFPHGPFASGACVSCHRPHSSENKALLSQSPKEICNMCHPEFAKLPNLHQPLAENGCSDCHDSHGSDNPYSLKYFGPDLCYSCHSKEREEYNKRFVHNPIRSDCVLCHNPHGSKYVALLKNDFDNQFYIEYREGIFKLCFDECHSQKLLENIIVRDPKDTNFRDGESNLHYRHIFSDKAVSCTVCHSAHASDQPDLIRNTDSKQSSYGYKIKYGKEKTGGKCTVACHKTTMSYDRLKPAHKPNSPVN